jgi:hypothetical protein
VYIAFRLKPNRDSDIISWLESLGEGDRSYAILEALRKGFIPAPPTFSHCPLPAITIKVRQVEEAQPTNEQDLEATLDSWL